MDGTDLPGGIWNLELVSGLREHLIWMRLNGRAECTVAARRRTCVRLAEWLGRDPVNATFEELYGWQAHLLKVSVIQVRHQTALLRPYFGWLHDLGRRPDNPCALLPMPRARRGLPRPIAEAVLVRVITEAPPRLLPWLLLAGWSGLRAAEIAYLRVDDFSVDERDQAWVRVIGKGDVERTTAIPDWAWPSIEFGLARTGPAWRRERGFGHVTAQHVSQYCNDFLHKVIGVPDTLHSLRHRVATVTYEQTGDLRLVQDLLGHASPQTTAVYTRVASRRLATAIGDLPHPTLPPVAARHLRAVDGTHGGTA